VYGVILPAIMPLGAGPGEAAGPIAGPLQPGVVYDLEGTLLEACSCLAVCPCWVGEDPDGGSCDAFNAYRFERGTIRGVDVSGLSFINVVHIPGNVLARGAGSW
jgi:hypothetical protein